MSENLGSLQWNRFSGFRLILSTCLFCCRVQDSLCSFNEILFWCCYASLNEQKIAEDNGWN